jgi:hypothetical protein
MSAAFVHTVNTSRVLRKIFAPKREEILSGIELLARSWLRALRGLQTRRQYAATKTPAVV